MNEIEQCPICGSDLNTGFLCPNAHCSSYWELPKGEPIKTHPVKYTCFCPFLNDEFDECWITKAHCVEIESDECPLTKEDILIKKDTR